MRFIFFSPDDHFENWDWRNPDVKGIGGSETSHIEMARRLKARGHEVISYNGLPEDSPGEWNGIPWRHYRDCNFDHEGIWVFYRCPAAFKTAKKPPGQVWWLILQDWDYFDADWNAVAEKVDRVWTLSKCQTKNMLERFPQLGPRLNMTSNGIKLDLIESVEAELKEKRDPFKVMFTSSPDRGLFSLARIFRKAREYEPRLNLHVFYGFDNIDKVIAENDRKLAETCTFLKNATLKALDQPNVVLHGRVPQRELTYHWLTAGIWCYPCVFHETSCITCMEAQACGAIPLLNPVWAQGENTHHGLFIEGNCEEDSYTQARFAAELAKLAGNEVLQQKIRPAMMADARRRFDWEVFVSQWIEAALIDTKEMEMAEQKSSEIKTPFVDAVMKKGGVSPSGGKTTGSESGLPGRTSSGNAMPEVNREQAG